MKTEDEFWEFQHTAARRRLGKASNKTAPQTAVSTHSRPKAAGHRRKGTPWAVRVSTHSRPKAAGVVCVMAAVRAEGFNTQPPEGGWPV